MKIQNLSINSAKKAMEVNPSLGLLIPVLTLLFSSLMAQAPQLQARLGVSDRAVHAVEQVGANFHYGIIPSIVSTVINQSTRDLPVLRK